MSEESKEVKKTKYLDTFKKLLEILENVPKALLAIGVVLGMLGTAYNTYMGTTNTHVNTQHETHVQTETQLNERLTRLETRSEILDRVILFKLMEAEGLLDDDVGYEEIILELPSGKMVPVPRK